MGYSTDVGKVPNISGSFGRKEGEKEKRRKEIQGEMINSEQRGLARPISPKDMKVDIEYFLNLAMREK